MSIPRAGDLISFELPVDPGAKIPVPGDEGKLKGNSIDIPIRYLKVLPVGIGFIKVEAEVIGLLN